MATTGDPTLDKPVLNPTPPPPATIKFASKEEKMFVILDAAIKQAVQAHKDALVTEMKLTEQLEKVKSNKVALQAQLGLLQELQKKFTEPL